MDNFILERYFDKYEFNSKYLLCSSDCEPLLTSELLELSNQNPEHLLDLSLGYTTSKGDINLRIEISKLYEKISEEEVLTFAGAQEAIYIFNRAILQKGDEVIVQSPCYQSLFQVSKEIGCIVNFWNMNPENSWQLEVEDLKRMITNKTKAIILNFPNNPSGYTISEDIFNEIVTIARKNKIYILCDEVYRFLEYNLKDALPPICDVYELGISVGVMSKSFGLPGLRIGWVAAKDKSIISKMNAYKDYTSLCNNVFGEHLSIIALQHKDKILSRNKKIIKSNVDYFRSFLEKHNTLFDCEIPKAGSVVFPKINIPMSTFEFCQEIHKKESVFLLPSEVYSFNSGYIRIGIGRKSFEQGLNVFDNFLVKNMYNGNR
jgi:aspartate/methionine/tyrosine aminotransferase